MACPCPLPHSVLWPGGACVIQGFFLSKLVDNGFLQMSGGVFVSKSGLFFFFFMFFPFASEFDIKFLSLPVSGPGSSVPKSLHLPSVSHSVLRNRRWERARTQGQPTKQSALCGAGCWVLGAVGVWGNAVSRFARKLGKL